MATQNQVLDKITQKQLLDRLDYLAGLWRETKSDEVVRRYHAVLMTLLELGYREWLDIEAELPERLMPPEYFDLMREASQIE